MTMTMETDIQYMLDDLVDGIEEGIEKGMKEATYFLYKDIMRAFDSGGPGWKPLSKKTLRKKRSSGAIDPRAILREFDVMKDSITSRKVSRFKYEVGIFANTSKKYDLSKQTGFRGSTNVVNRAKLHEFGGIEEQTKFVGIEEIITGGLRKKALRGEGEIIKNNREIRKKRKRFKITQWVRIPERSFLRMPFDRSRSKIIEIIEESVYRLL